MTDLRALVTSLIGEEVHALQLLGEGGDHLVYEVNHNVVLRIRKQRDRRGAAATAREAALLALLAEVSSVPVPSVVTLDSDRCAIVMTKLPGSSLFEAPSRDPMALCDQLGSFISNIHGLPLDDVRDVAPRDDTGLDVFLAEATKHVPLVAGHLPPGGRRVLETFVSTPPPPRAAMVTFCHNDLGAEHLLATSEGTVLTGVIDWSDAAIADPARDLGLIFRDLGRDVAAAVLSLSDATRADTIWTRAAFYARCALLEDLAYGLLTPDRRYVEHALRRFNRTFSDE